MGSILPFLRKTGIALDDHGTKAIGEAFDAACIALHDSGQPQIVYEPRAASGMSIAWDAGLAALGDRSDGEG